MTHANGNWMNADQHEAAAADALFPIMGSKVGQRRGFVPMAFIRRAKANCLSNHDQSPERLRERGGLSPQEAMAVINGTRWGSWKFPSEEAAWEHLQVIVVAEFPGFNFTTGEWIDTTTNKERP